MPTRRDLLKTTAVGAASCILSKTLFAKQPGSNFHFIHTNTLNSWPLTDPVQWSIDHAHDPILARAAEGLGKLTECDGDRIIRLVVRRCSLNLLEVRRNQVDVQFWGQQGLADLKPFFKLHGLAHPQIEVVLKDRKKETVTTLTGDSLLYGIPIASDFDLELFKNKWERRFEKEADDCTAAPETSSRFAWGGLPDGQIPWAAMKRAWRSGSGVCLNCAGETLLVNFGLRQVGMFNRAGFCEYVCGGCRRSFRDSVDVEAWMSMNLDDEVRPDSEMVRGKRMTLEAQS